MDNGSLIDLVTSVDPQSVAEPIRSLGGLVNGVAQVVLGLINMWNVGSMEAAGSIQTVLGSIAGL